jgi:hypothetical protein
MNDEAPNWILRAADTRAQGGSMLAAAEACGKPHGCLRHWIRLHKRAWFRVLQSARREARDSACDEAVARLRQQLRADEQKAIFEAAAAIAKNFPLPELKPRPGRPSGDADPLHEWMTAVPDGVTTRVDQHLQASEEEGSAALATDRGPGQR